MRLFLPILAACLFLTGCTAFSSGTVGITNYANKQRAIVPFDSVHTTVIGEPLAIEFYNGEQTIGEFYSATDSLLLLTSASDTTSIALVDVKHIRKTWKKHPILPAALLGAFFDAVIIYAMITFSPNIDLRF